MPCSRPLSDDLNTPQMIAALHGSAECCFRNGQDRGAVRSPPCGSSVSCPRARRNGSGRKQQASGIDAKQIDELISSRTAARARKDFRESDRIRDELAAMGVVIKDSKEGTTWEIAR